MRIALLLAFPGLAFAFDVVGEHPGSGAHEGELPSVPEIVDAPIINGEPAAEDLFPMAGALLFGTALQEGGDPIKMMMCTSTLIAPDVVLLAAHCVDLQAMLDMYGGGFQFYGETFAWTRQADLTGFDFFDDWPDDAVFATEVVAHPGFDIASFQVGLADNDDIALMFLDEPVFDVPFAILPTVEEDAALAVGQEVDVVGWGQQTANPYGPVAEKMWGTSFINEMGATEFQVGAEVNDVRKCHGDSGGPSFAYVETESAEKMRVVGVTSHAYDDSDCNETGGVDTRVGAYLAWIHEEMSKRCQDGTRAWCETPGVIAPPDENGLMAWEKGEPEEESKACGCNAAGGASSGLLVLLAGLLVRRRR